MTHPLASMIFGNMASLYPIQIGKPYACVTVEAKGKDFFIIPSNISIAKLETLFVPLPNKFRVLSPDGSGVVRPTHRFWITTETFNPFHLIIDWDGKI